MHKKEKKGKKERKKERKKKREQIMQNAKKIKGEKISLVLK